MIQEYSSTRFDKQLNSKTTFLHLFLLHAMIIPFYLQKLMFYFNEQVSDSNKVTEKCISNTIFRRNYSHLK